jgi:hypothetical protein
VTPRGKGIPFNLTILKCHVTGCLESECGDYETSLVVKKDRDHDTNQVFSNFSDTKVLF